MGNIALVLVHGDEVLLGHLAGYGSFAECGEVALTSGFTSCLSEDRP